MAFISGRDFLFVLLGAATSSLVIYIYINNKDKKNERVERKGGCNYTSDDNCNSLYYDNNINKEGKGFTHAQVGLDKKEIVRLNTIHPEYRRISYELYSTAVQQLPIVCIDIICQRIKDEKVLLFYRKDKPAASIWWWPGGRLFKGRILSFAYE